MKAVNEVLLKHESISGITTSAVAAMLARFAARWAPVRERATWPVLPCHTCGAATRTEVALEPVWCGPCWADEQDVPW